MQEDASRGVAPLCGVMQAGDEPRGGRPIEAGAGMSCIVAVY